MPGPDRGSVVSRVGAGAQAGADLNAHATFRRTFGGLFSANSIDSRFCLKNSVDWDEEVSWL